MPRRIKYYSKLEIAKKDDLANSIGANQIQLMDVRWKDENRKAALISVEEDEWLVIIDDDKLLKKSESFDEDQEEDDDYESDDSAFEIQDNEEE